MELIFVGAETIRAQFAGGMISPVFHLKEPKFYQINSGNTDQITVYGEYFAYSDLASKMLLSERQRVTFCYRRENNEWRIYHMHVSNPWSQVSGNEIFPDQISQQTYEYLQECIDAQKKQIETQTAILERLSFEDDLTKLYNRNKFIQTSEHYKTTGLTHLGIASFDLNKLKEVNDRFGHSAGDKLICRTAHIIKQAFNGKTYRLGGDEFVVMDADLDKASFFEAVTSVKNQLSEEEISISAGISWRSSLCNIDEQLDEADLFMYQEKRQMAVFL